MKKPTRPCCGTRARQISRTGHGKEPLNAISAKVINPALKAYAEASGLAWLDMSEKFLGDDGEIKPGLMLPDNLHPIKAGYEIWLGGLAPAVEKLME